MEEMEDGELREESEEEQEFRHELEDVAAMDGVFRFESLDTGDAVLIFSHATSVGQVSLAISHEMDGDLEVFMTPKLAEDLALALARASDQARAGDDE
jgi:hypothetical protein